ncbi:MAG: class I adenylate-forming enzyme family protein [Acidimicrobiia bacterium]
MTASDSAGAGEGFTLRYRGHETLTEEQHAVLFGPGAPFEFEDVEVLGSTLAVLVNRARDLRQILLQAAARFGDQPYFVFPEETVTFAETPQRVADIARVLADEYGVGRGDRVSFASANSLEYALAQWAVICLGGITVGLNGWWTGPELVYGIELTQPKAVFGDPPRLDRLAEVGALDDIEAPVVLLADLFAQVAARTERDGPAALPEPAIAEDDPFMILFTSGTTGRPKGATLSHRNVIAMAGLSPITRAVQAVRTGVTPPPPTSPPAVLAVSPFFHISGTSALLMTSVNFGTTLVFPPAGRWDPLVHLQLTEKHRVTSWSGVPTQYWRILEHPDFDSFDVSSVGAVSSGGAPFAPELMRLFEQKMPNAIPSNGYGMSESMGAGTLLIARGNEDKLASVGSPWAGLEVQIRDEMNTVLPEGEIGEICLRGATIFLGYWDNPEATAAAIDEGRWYHTGDYGRIEDGVLWLESRIRDLIIRGGENIYPMEIEHRLVEHPDISDAAVIGVDHRELGQEVKAFVVLRAGATMTEGDVQEWAAQALARFKVPTYVEFRTELPYTATGKVMKHTLEAEEVAGA